MNNLNINKSTLKCMVSINIADIPFDFREERERLFDNIVNNLYNTIEDKNMNAIIFPDYSGLNSILIYKYTESGKDNNDDNLWCLNIKDIFSNNTLVKAPDVYSNDINADYVDYSVYYLLDFSYSNNFYISPDIKG